MKARSLRGEIGRNSPCRGCDERHPICHADCERYAAYKKENEEIREKRNELGRLMSTLNAGEHRRSTTRIRRNV